MARAILEFDLNEPDDVKAHIRCVKSLDMATAIWEIRRIQRDVQKYGKSEKMALSEISMALEDINIDELIS